MNTRPKQKSERGKSMVEFVLLAPVLLTIAGGTIEVANYMRANQIATVMSQEIANSSYRQCADITRVTQLQSTQAVAVAVDLARTSNQVQACLSTIQSAAQTRLAALLPGLRTQVRVAAFRTDPFLLTLEKGCSDLTQLGLATATQSTSSAGISKNDSYRQKSMSPDDNRNGGSASDDPTARGSIEEHTREIIAVSGKAIMREGEVLVSAQSACQRKNIVVSEVTVEIPRIVKFVPRIISDGKNRATTTL